MSLDLKELVHLYKNSSRGELEEAFEALVWKLPSLWNVGQSLRRVLTENERAELAWHLLAPEVGK